MDEVNAPLEVQQPATPQVQQPAAEVQQPVTPQVQQPAAEVQPGDVQQPTQNPSA